jgi:hypothetical protein
MSEPGARRLADRVGSAPGHRAPSRSDPPRASASALPHLAIQDLHDAHRIGPLNTFANRQLSPTASCSQIGLIAVANFITAICERVPTGWWMLTDLQPISRRRRAVAESNHVSYRVRGGLASRHHVQPALLNPCIDRQNKSAPRPNHGFEEQPAAFLVLNCGDHIGHRRNVGQNTPNCADHSHFPQCRRGALLPMIRKSIKICCIWLIKSVV